MNILKKLIILHFFLLISGEGLASAKIDWPVLINIDPTHIDFGKDKPKALRCDYIPSSYPAGANVSYWIALQNEEIRISTDQISAVRFGFKSKEHLGYVFQRLHCEGEWEKPHTTALSYTCNNVAPNSTIDIGAGIISGQCTVAKI